MSKVPGFKTLQHHTFAFRLVSGEPAWSTVAGGVPMKDAILFDLLAEWAPDAATRNRILVTNPEMLYSFTKTS